MKWKELVQGPYESRSVKVGSWSLIIHTAAGNKETRVGNNIQGWEKTSTQLAVVSQSEIIGNIQGVDTVGIQTPEIHI